MTFKTKYAILWGMENETNREEDVVIDNDIRRLNFWKFYLKPTSETYGNGQKSAIKAGYGPGYAANITSQDFFKRKLRRMNLLGKAEKVLDESLDVKHLDKDGKVDAATLRVKVDSAKFVAKTLGKDEGYTERAEVTGKNGTPVIVMPSELVNKFGLNGMEGIEDDGEAITLSDGEVIKEVINEESNEE